MADNDAQRLRRGCLLAAVLAVAGQWVMVHPPFVSWPFSHTSMLSVHLLLELVAFVVAVMVIGVSWYALDEKDGGARNILIAGFTAVACCDLVHALTYEGMPALLNEASTPRAIFFWLAGRSIEVLTFGVMALPWRWRATRHTALLLGVSMACGLVWVGSFALDVLPVTFVKGKGVTSFKAGYEYLLSAANLLVAVCLWRKARAGGLGLYYLLATAAFFMAVGELAFTSYVTPSDFQNIFGHLYKVAAYLLLFQATFVSSVRAPFDALRISERRMAEREEQLASIIASTADGIVTLDAQHRIVVFNQAAQTMFGVSAEVAAASRLDRFIREASPDRIDAYAQGPAGPDMDRVLRTGIRADGSTFTIECARSKVGQGGEQLITALVRDVSERERVAREVASAMQRFRTLFYAAPSTAIILAADSWVVREVNDAAITRHGLTRERVIGHRLPEIGLGFLEADLSAFAQEIRMQGRVAGMHARARVGDGTLRDFLVAAEPIDYSGEPCLLVMGQDITERIAAEEALRVLNIDLESRVDERTAQLRSVVAELELARDRAEAATHAKGEFLANMSHEIRTPINAVIGLTDLALRMASDARQRDYLAKTQMAADALLQLVDRILDFSKIEARRLELESAPFDLNALVQQVVTIIETRAEAKGLALQVALDERLPQHLVGDVHRLRQVLLNLCGNAVKFTDQGAVTVRVVRDDGQSTRPGHVLVRFEVQDTGIGLSPAQQDRIFQPFMQADSSTTRRHGGTGLGLSISRQLVELMGGALDVRSTPGAGSTFSFGIEVAIAGAPSPAVAASAQAGRGPSPVAQLGGRRVLLVEDNELNQLVAGDLLRDVAGMTVVIAGDGASALAALTSDRFDVVMCDVQMPGMDGFELTRRIRAQWSADVLPVVAVTAYASVRDKELCLACGMNEYITKPFDPQTLFRVMAGVLGTVERHGDGEVASREPLAGGVSLQLGLARCLGQRTLFDKVVRRYLAELRDAPEQLQARLAAGEQQAAAMLAHDLVSSAGVVGAMRLSELARELYEAITGQQPGQSASLLAALAGEHRVVREALQHHLADTTPA